VTRTPARGALTTVNWINSPEKEPRLPTSTPVGLRFELFVQDVESSVRFYRSTLGLEPPGTWSPNGYGHSGLGWSPSACSTSRTCPPDTTSAQAASRDRAVWAWRSSSRSTTSTSFMPQLRPTPSFAEEAWSRWPTSRGDSATSGSSIPTGTTYGSPHSGVVPPAPPPTLSDLIELVGDVVLRWLPESAARLPVALRNGDGELAMIAMCPRQCRTVRSAVKKLRKGEGGCLGGGCLCFGLGNGVAP